jgi:nucleotide-binding universal stress UspA family protein
VGRGDERLTGCRSSPVERVKRPRVANTLATAIAAILASGRARSQGEDATLGSGAATTRGPWCPPDRRAGASGLPWTSEEADDMTTILVGTDTSAAADLAVRDAARLALERDGKLVVLYVRPGGDLRTVVDPRKAADPARYLASMAGRFPGVDTSTRVEDGDPAERIVAVAEEEGADTIVLGNRDTHGSRWRVRDSVPNLVLRHAPCSVFIVDTRRAQ